MLPGNRHRHAIHDSFTGSLCQAVPPPFPAFRDGSRPTRHAHEGCEPRHRPGTTEPNEEGLNPMISGATVFFTTVFIVFAADGQGVVLGRINLAHRCRRRRRAPAPDGQQGIDSSGIPQSPHRVPLGPSAAS